MSSVDCPPHVANLPQPAAEPATSPPRTRSSLAAGPPGLELPVSDKPGYAGPSVPPPGDCGSRRNQGSGQGPGAGQLHM